MSYGRNPSYTLPPAIGASHYPPSDPTLAHAAAQHHAQQQAAFASSAALGLAQMSASGSGSGSAHEESVSVEPELAGEGAGSKGKGKDKDKDGAGGGDGEKKKQTRGARACTVCRKLKMRCVGAEEGPPCKRCKNGGHECIFEESQRGKRSNRKTDAMAKSLKSMEAKLESVLASISAPGMLAGSGGLVTDPSQRMPYAPLDSGPGGAEGRGDVLVGASHGSLDPAQVASALEQIRAGNVGGAAAAAAALAGHPAVQGSSAGGAQPPLARADPNSAIIRKDPIVLPSLASADTLRYELGGGVGAHAEIGPSRTGGHPAHLPSHHHHPAPHVHWQTQTTPPIPLGGMAGSPALHPLPHSHVHAMAGYTGRGRGTSVGAGSQTSKSSPGTGGVPMEWSGVKDPAAADGSPRLHSLPDNTLNPLGLLAEASLRNTRKRPMDITSELGSYDVTGDLHHESPPPNGGAGKGKNAGKGKGKGKGNAKGKDGAEGAEEEEEEEGPAKKKQKKDDERTQAAKKPLGMANRNYFAPGPMNILPLRRIVIEQRMPPALLEEKILSVEEVVELFALFFEHCARHCPFLDPEIHTPAATGSRSPFLFTCICTVAARYYTKRTDDLYRKCLRVAKRVAFDVMTKGYKSTEICQGFLLLCNWNQPAERFEEERTYQFSGIAIRMATDLNLHRKTIAQLPPDIGDETRVLYERELLNRERAWLYSFICDRSVSTQMGKPYSISKEDFIIRNAATWHRQSGCQPSDSGLSAMVEMQRIVGRMIDVLYSDTRSVSGLNAHLDYQMLIRAFLQQLDQWRQDWSDPGALLGDPDEENLKARAIMRDFYHAYYRLFLLSFAVQHALEDPSSAIDLPSYCVLCFESAERMIIILRDFIGPLGILRYAIDSTFVYASYAATFLLKLVSPTFASFIDEEAAMRLVRETAETLEAAAVDEQHTPALYASFLRMLIENKLNGPKTAANSRAPTRPGSPVGNALGFGGASGMNAAFTNPGAYMNGGTPSAAGLEMFLKSRAPSVGPDGTATPGFSFDATLGGAFPGGLGDASFGFNGMNGGEFTAAGGEGGPAFDSLMVDDVLSANGFWSSMLMPGFGGPLAGLSGGSGTVFSNNPADPYSITPFHSRPPSPSLGSTPARGAPGEAGSFDFLPPPTPAGAGARADGTGDGEKTAEKGEADEGGASAAAEPTDAPAAPAADAEADTAAPSTAEANGEPAVDGEAGEEGADAASEEKQEGEVEPKEEA
ncbi:hypothetical protein JCM10207_002434 [Rhodosporidiobolus poonsookiae]